MTKKGVKTGKREVIPLSEKQLSKAKQIVAEGLEDNPNIYNLPPSGHSADEIATLFVERGKGKNKRILPKEKRRYVIYLRKSTDDEAKQVRSVEDQRIECLSLAKRLDINVREEDIIEEKGSAKISNNRPFFTKMMKGFQTGKYHGLISWSPDRLSRNMKEAGEIIEMIDEERIQDLLFCTYSFENTPNGKMMLGILFATSKQYSDKLSVDVMRGITGNIKDGKYNGTIKKGYYADTTTGYFMPDGHNWRLLRKVVNMRLIERKTNQEVADFLNDAHFSYRKNQDDNYKIAKMTKKNVGDMFKDPFYCGVYLYGDNVANLNELYNFMPLITADEFIALGRDMADTFSAEFVGRNSVSKRLDFGLLREKVICDYCDKIMVFQRNVINHGKNKGRYMISYYCRNKDCIRHHDDEAMAKFGKKLSRSIRAKYVTAYIEWTLRHLAENTEKAYDLYITRLKDKLAVEKQIAKNKLADAKTELKKQQTYYSKYQNLQLEDLETYKRHHEGKLEHHQHLINLAEENMEQQKAEVERLNKALPTREQFVELVQSYLKTILTTNDLIEEDLVYQEAVLNLRAGDNAISVINLNPPYNLMADLTKVSIGGRGGT